LKCIQNSVGVLYQKAAAAMRPQQKRFRFSRFTADPDFLYDDRQRILYALSQVKMIYSIVLADIP
jgi:hypothetical protein